MTNTTTTPVLTKAEKRAANKAAAQAKAKQHAADVLAADAATKVLTADETATLLNTKTPAASKTETPVSTAAEKKAAETKRRSEGVAKSWENPEVKKARATHHAVKVDGVLYKSVRAAFRALKLNESKHIPFRAQVKAAGEGVFQGHDFKLVAVTETAAA